MAIKDIQYLWFVSARGHIHQVLRQRLDQLNTVVGEIHEARNGADDPNGIEVRTKVLHSIEDLHNSIAEYEFEDIHSSWLNGISNLETQVDKTETKVQKPDRFSGPGLTTRARLFKPFKRIAFKLEGASLRAGNLFRKEKKKHKNWNHRIKLRALFRLRFRNDFLVFLSEFERSSISDYNALLQEIKAWEESDSKIRFDTTRKFQEWKNSWDKELEKFYEAQTEQFGNDRQTAGTLDFPNRQLESKWQERNWTRNLRKWAEQYNGSLNVSYAICEDWRSDLELTRLNKSSLLLKEELVQEFYVWKGTILQDHFDKLEAYFETSRNEIETGKDIPESSIFKALSYRIKKELDTDIIQPLTAILSRNTLLNQVNKTEYLFEQKIEELSSKFAVVRSGNWDRLLAPRDFTYISGYELVSFEMAPKLNRSFSDIKQVLRNTLESIILRINDLDEIVSYTVETAESIASEDATEARQMVINGLERAQERLLESKTNLIGMVDRTVTEHLSSIDQFALGLLELTINENLNQIRFRISKAKAMQRSGNLKTGLVNRVKQQLGRIKDSISHVLGKLASHFTGLRKKIIPTDATRLQARELSDFLITSRKEVEKLPFIYKKLYKISALTDPFLFEGREVEIDEIAQAYKAWKEEKYAAVLLHGEKWSGITSLVNQLPNHIKFRESVKVINIEKKCLDTTGFYRFWSEQLGTEVNTQEELVEALMAGNQMVIVLENIQHLYLRTLEGGECIRLLLKTVAATCQQIFWIQTLSTYGFQYLERVHNLSGFFSYVVGLRELSDDQLRALITKRNRISGYEIIFEPGQRETDDKKFQKMTVAEQQVYLERRFYKSMTDYARSNISMALHFWLLSTRKVDGKRVHIRKYNKPEDSFLSQITSEKLHLLHVLVLHDGLSQIQLARVLRSSPEDVELILLEMTEDGLLGKLGDRVVIDPIVYRVIIELLKSKNLIH